MPEHTPYYRPYDDVFPEKVSDFTSRQTKLWKFFAGLALGFSIWYLIWRWSASLNPDAYAYSVIIASAETLCVVGLLLFYYDIWEEPPRRAVLAPVPRLAGGNSVDIFIATYDEDEFLVRDTVFDAMRVRVPAGWNVTVHVLDDGDRSEMRAMAQELGAKYHARNDNYGFKAGNLKNALARSDGDFVVIADADTRFLPSFLENTLGYFHDPRVGWVQTPHWFYDVPQGKPVSRWLPLHFGCDPFLTDPTIFFDVIQRRRDRHGASFCCGAGSIHRRAAICEQALTVFRGHPVQNGKYVPVQPFKFHVSEDLYTSIQMHGQGWRSVYHPEVESRMLSPWSLDAWAAQKLKYAGGTFDIFINTLTPWKRQIPFRTWLHYMATFWSYLSVFPMLVLFIAPNITLMTGMLPISSYSLTFFIHLMPMLIFAEIALFLGCKGHNIHSARTLSVATAPYILRAFGQVLLRQKIGFRPTPKTLKTGPEYRFVSWQIAMFIASFTALLYGVVQFGLGAEGYSAALMIVNGFWVIRNMMVLLQVIRLARWTPETQLQQEKTPCLQELH